MVHNIHADSSIFESISVRVQKFDFETFSNLWHNLEERSDSSFFISRHWIETLVNISSADFFVIIAEVGIKIVGLGLITRPRIKEYSWFKTRGVLLNESGDDSIDMHISIEYNSFLFDKNIGYSVFRVMLQFIRNRGNSLLGHFDEFVINGASPANLYWGRRAGFIAWVHSRKHTSYVDLAEIRTSGIDYLDHLGKNTRYQINRSIKLYENKSKIVIKKAKTTSEALFFLDKLKDLHQEYWISKGKPGSFAFPSFEKFHQELIKNNFEYGVIELLEVFCGNEPIGYLYNFVYRKKILSYQSGFKYVSDKKLKPGLVSHYLCVNYHLGDDSEIYDFLAGNERYKRNLGTPGADMLRVIFRIPKFLIMVDHGMRILKYAMGNIVSLYSHKNRA